MSAAAFRATFADFKIIKTRKVAVFCFEVPLETADASLQSIGGLPTGDERWCGIARLNVAPVMDTPAEKPRRPFDRMIRAQQAGILCADQQFQGWLRVLSEAEATEEIYRRCNIASRRDLNFDVEAAVIWDGLVTDYRIATGQMAAPR